MASPHAAGLAALLVSALAQSNMPVVAARVRQALVTTAQPLDGLTVVDQGGGLPNVGRAWSWLAGKFRWMSVRAEAYDRTGTRGPTAFYGNGLGGVTEQRWQFEWDSTVTLPARVTFRSDAAWLRAPASYTFTRWNGGVTTTFDPRALQAPGTYVGTVTMWGTDTMAGPVARLVHTIVVPAPPGTDLIAPAGPLQPGLEHRWSFGAQAGRPFQVSVASSSSKDVIRAYLHEPGGQPFRGGHEQEGSTGDQAAIFRLDARDVVTGNYEVVAAAPPIATSSAGLELMQAPFTMSADLIQGVPVLALRSMVSMPVTVNVGGAIIGGAREESMSGVGADTGRLDLDLPGWVRRVEIDVEMPPGDWPKFTDFGVTLEDADGRQIEKSPLNYAVGRLTTELPRARSGGMATLKLFPGWATLVPGQRWNVTVRVRYYGEEARAVVLTPQGASTITLAPNTPEGIRFTAAASPWTLPEGFVPLARWSAGVAGKDPWTLEAPFAKASTPLMPGPR